MLSYFLPRDPPVYSAMFIYCPQDIVVLPYLYHAFLILTRGKIEEKVRRKRTFPLVPGYDQRVIRQALPVRVIGRQALAGDRVIETDGQMIDLSDGIRGEGVNILNDFA